MKRLSTPQDVAAAVGNDEALAGWSVTEQGEASLSLERGGDTVALAWAADWDGDKPNGSARTLWAGTDEEFEQATALPSGLVSLPTSARRLAASLESECARSQQNETAAALERARSEKQLLIDIGRLLSQQRDIDSLLEIILDRACEVTGADAGSVYVVEGDAEEIADRSLRFTVSQNASIDISPQGFTIPISPQSIVGTCALNAEVVNIPDLYQLDPAGTGNNPWGFQHDRSWDDRHGYMTRSMVTVPMVSARHEVIGVIQLINRKLDGHPQLSSTHDFENAVVAFNDEAIDFAVTLASQAGIALENALLYDEVKTLFDGFVKASVTAIEARDPTTSGHSERVAQLTLGLAVAADRCEDGPYSELTFSPDELVQIEYAALLHDFGKVGVREHVLVKAKKLYPHEEQAIRDRFQFIRQTVQRERSDKKVSYLLEASREQVAERLSTLDVETTRRLEELDEFLTFILEANEPSVLEQGGFERLADIATERYTDLRGQDLPFLSVAEVAALQVPRGSLTPEERLEIESHVVHTHNFLKQIPWGRTLHPIPDIAVGHHEKLDGSGYPYSLTGGNIPVQTRMLTVSDIYDALTASDRPYKRAVPSERALEILGYEVKDEHVDADLLKIFIEARVFEAMSDDLF